MRHYFEQAEASETRYGTEDAKVYRDYEELLADQALRVPDLNNWHAPMTIAALHAGKHVMCEKPMAKTAAEARAMVDAAKATGKLLTIGYQNRFRQDVQYLHKCVGRSWVKSILPRPMR